MFRRRFVLPRSAGDVMTEISRKILCVDDDGNWLSALKRRLRRKFDITTAIGGPAGLEILGGPGSFAVVTADFKMPGMNGIEFLREARRVSPDSVPLMLTGCAQLDIAVSALHDGHIYRFLTKPCPPELLETTLADCVEKYRSAAIERLLNTQLSRANEELRTLNATLENAREEALAATRAKSEFLATMSHELRTPMNSIIGFTELMIDDEQDPPTGKRARRLEKVHRNARNLLALLNDLLDLSKIEAERLTLEWVSVDVAALVHECVESTRPLLKNGRVELTPHIQSQLPRCEGDPVRLRQIVTNLLSNAAKFTTDGCIAVRAFVQDGCMLIDVEDSGIGICGEDLPKVFDKFEQVDSSSTRRAGGTGLGLAICRKLCELMGGRITVKSELGVGSCFTVRLPLKQASCRTGDEGCVAGLGVIRDATGYPVEDVGGER